MSASGTISRTFIRAMVLAITALAVAFPSPARAATITVSTQVDEAGTGADCSLREAVQAANTNAAYGGCPAGASGEDNISLFTGNYTLTQAGAEEDGNLTGDLDVTEALTIDGWENHNTFIQASATAGNGIDRVLDTHGVSLTLMEVTVRHGNAQGTESQPRNGGGIRAAAGSSLTLINTNVRNNTTGAGPGQGGGIWISGTLSLPAASLNNTQVTDNSAGDSGGGIYKTGDQPTSMDSTLIFNNSAARGAGFALVGGGATLDSVSISGNDASIQGGGIYNCTAADPALTITESAIEGNTAGTTQQGGGIYSCATGAVSLADSQLTGNSAGSGGGMFNGAPLTVTNTGFAYNAAYANFGSGGGLYNQASAGATSLTRTTFDQNAAPGSNGNGGAISNAAGTLSVTNSTFGFNVAGATGGALRNDATATVSFTTFSNNDANTGGLVSGAAGGAVFSGNTSTTSVGRSILANSAGTDADCGGTITTLGHNLIETPSTCAFTGTGTGDMTGVDPQLGPLGDYGGETDMFEPLIDTFPLEMGSPALDDIPGADCSATVDRRGYPRPADGPDVDTDEECDIGSYEAIVMSITDASVAEVDPPGTSTATFDVTLSKAIPEDFTFQANLVLGTASSDDLGPCSYCGQELTASAGWTGGAFQIDVVGDVYDEPNETFSLSLESVSPYFLLADSQGEGTIIDDDSPAASRERSVSLSLRKHLKARGRVTVLDGPAKCRKSVDLEIQRKKPSGWTTIATPTSSRLGRYSSALPDKQGRYRTRALPRRVIAGGEEHVCSAAKSKVDRHRHS